MFNYNFLLGVLLSVVAPAAPHSNKSLIREWKTVDTKIRTISAKETALTNEKLNLELSINEATENIKVLSEVIDEKRDLILGRIRYLNQESGGDFIRNIIEAANPGELERSHNFLMIVNGLDIDLIRQYNRDIVKLENERQKYSFRISKLNELHRDLQTQTDTFYRELKNKSEIIGKIRRRLKSNSKNWAQELKTAIAEKNSEKENLYRSLLNKSLLDRKGQLTSPTDGNIKLNFGIVKLDSLAPALPFHGVLFDSPVGTPVRAMSDGTVAWLGSVRGLGETIVLDHGGNFHSIYSRVRLANLRIGDMIEEGATLGRIGLATGRLAAGLYFEVRERALPTDPLRWILIKSELFTKESNQWENVQ